MSTTAPIVFIVGPTASGKSDAAVVLAGMMNAQIVSCDSMLVYQEPRILTNKPSSQALGAILHHCIGMVPVAREYSVHQYYQDARACIERLTRAHVPVVVCGGTGMYMKVLLDGIIEGAGKDERLRHALYERVQNKGSAGLHAELTLIDPVSAARISPQDAQRIVRALEVFHTSGKPLSALRNETQGIAAEHPVRIFGLRMGRACLYARINARTQEMFNAGAVQEADALLAGALSSTASKIIGLAEIRRYQAGECTLQETIEKTAQNTRRYAKRQMTWFNAEKRLEWIEAENATAKEIAYNIHSRAFSTEF